ncbi:hypothetical protein EI94DRAFT_1832826 [Lactarius quietus]|nr:hypothetical protein EI94DRAFT_1832826 [Lactarius quietus]
MPNLKGKTKATLTPKKYNVESEGEGTIEGKGKDDSVLAVMEQLDFVAELLDSWRDSLAHQLAAAETKEHIQAEFSTLFLKDRRVFPGTEEGWADGSRKRRRLLDDVGIEDPHEEDQREVLEDFLTIIRNTKNYAKMSPHELAAFNKVMDEAMLKWALFRQINPERQDPENVAL